MKIIPIFIPHAGCPYRCIYCDQHKISGAVNIPSEKDIKFIISRNLKTISKNERVELAFFGGTFTLLPETLQRKYLEVVSSYVKSRKIAGIRMSTHPEAVTEKSMKLFKKMGGCLVELGVQSLDKDVLNKCGRAISFGAVKNACCIIEKAGLDFGVQIMLGLPGDTFSKSEKTALQLIKLKPKTSRIYPAIVLKGTGLADLFEKGGYKPLSIEDAIEWSARICDIFEKAGVRVIRIGLHPSEDLNLKSSVLAGPYHVSFGEMARARQMRHKIINILGPKKIPNRRIVEICASKGLFNFISGHKGEEKRFLEDYYAAPIRLTAITPAQLSCKRDKSRLQSRDIAVKDIRKGIAVIDSRMPYPAKKRLKQMGYYIAETPLHPKLADPVKGHPDMMLFSYGKKIVYEPHLEKIAGLLRDNGYDCVKGESITASSYPQDIIYDACGLGKFIIRYEGKIEKHIENIRAEFIKVKQGYVKCSVVVLDDNSIITSDKPINDKWIAGNKNASSLLIKPGYIKLPGYDTGFIGGTSGVHNDKVFFAGALKNHPDGPAMRDFIKNTGKKIVELCDEPLYDSGSILFF